MFIFDKERLEKIALDNSKIFRDNQPFPHLIIDNFLSKKEAEIISDKFPKPGDIAWSTHGSGANSDKENFKGIKLQCSIESEFPKSIKNLMNEFNSQSYLYFLKKLTGIDYILGDPYYNGCGLHSTGNGGRLMIHADVNRFPYPELADQYLNSIYYASKEWEEDWGGNLELWDKSCKKCVKSIAPKFNRLVIFNTNRTAFHGHPNPIKCPENKRRNSLATYYYVPTNNLNQSKSRQVQTVLWKRTNKLDRRLSVKFIKYSVHSFILDFTPPILLRKIIYLKNSIKNMRNNKVVKK